MEAEPQDRALASLQAYIEGGIGLEARVVCEGPDVIAINDAPGFAGEFGRKPVCDLHAEVTYAATGGQTADLSVAEPDGIGIERDLAGIVGFALAHSKHFGLTILILVREGDEHIIPDPQWAAIEIGRKMEAAIGRGVLGVHITTSEGIAAQQADERKRSCVTAQGLSIQGIGEDSTDRADKLWRRCLLYTSPSPRDRQKSRMPSSA